MRVLSSPIGDWTRAPCSGKHRVLTTGSPGKSVQCTFNRNIKPSQEAVKFSKHLFPLLFPWPLGNAVEKQEQAPSLEVPLIVQFSMENLIICQNKDKINVLKRRQATAEDDDAHPGSLLLSPLRPEWSRGRADMLRLRLGRPQRKESVVSSPPWKKAGFGKTPFPSGLTPRYQMQGVWKEAPPYDQPRPYKTKRFWNKSFVVEGSKTGWAPAVYSFTVLDSKQRNTIRAKCCFSLSLH